MKVQYDNQSLNLDQAMTMFYFFYNFNNENRSIRNWNLWRRVIHGRAIISIWRSLRQNTLVGGNLFAINNSVDLFDPALSCIQTSFIKDKKAQMADNSIQTEL